MSSDRLRHIRPVAPVLLSIALLEFGVGVLNPLVGYQLTLRDVPTQAIGIIASCYFVGYVSGALTAARVADRVGHIRAITVFTVVMAAGVLLLALTESPVIWGVIRMTMGYGMGGLFVCVESWLNHKATTATRGRIFSVYLTIAHGCGMAGPMALVLFDPTGVTLFLVVAIFYATSIIPMAVTHVGNPEIGERVRLGLVRLFRISPLGVVVACFGAMASTSFGQMAPVFVRETGLTAAHLATLLTFNRLGAILTQLPVGYLSDKFGRRPMMVGCAAVALAGALAALAFGDMSFTVLAACSMVMIGAGAPLYGLGTAHTCDRCKPDEILAASGGQMLAWSVGAVVGPYVAAVTMDLVGAHGIFIHTGTIYVAIILYALYRSARRGAPSQVGAGRSQSAAVPAEKAP
ncbi:MAG: MFS transporter [Alphaproteobacteria bacterium]|nr:MFS transporter [Alphaproteobacteria bacterium]